MPTKPKAGEILEESKILLPVHTKNPRKVGWRKQFSLGIYSWFATDRDSTWDCLSLELDLCLPVQVNRQWEAQRKIIMQYKSWASSFLSWGSLRHQGRSCFVLFLTWLTQMVRHSPRPGSSNLLLIFIFLTWKSLAPHEFKCREGF